MKRLVAILLSVLLVFGLAGCINIVIPGETEDAGSTEAQSTEAQPTEAQPTETQPTEPASTAPASTEAQPPEPAETETTLEAGLFIFEGNGSSNIQDEYLYLQPDFRFSLAISYTDGTATTNVVGNYILKDGKVLCYDWFTNAGDSVAKATPQEGRVYEIKDEDTLVCTVAGETRNYLREKDERIAGAYATGHSIAELLSFLTLENKYGTPSDGSPNSAAAIAYYVYDVDEGFLRMVELYLFDNGQYYLECGYDDGSAGSREIGNYYFDGSELYCIGWFSGGGDPGLSLLKNDKDQYHVAPSGDLTTSAFQGSTGGLDILLKKDNDKDLAALATSGPNVGNALEHSILSNK